MSYQLPEKASLSAYLGRWSLFENLTAGKEELCRDRGCPVYTQRVTAAIQRGQFDGNEDGGGKMARRKLRGLIVRESVRLTLHFPPAAFIELSLPATPVSIRRPWDMWVCWSSPRRHSLTHNGGKCVNVSAHSDPDLPTRWLLTQKRRLDSGAHKAPWPLRASGMNCYGCPSVQSKQGTL